MLRQKWGQLSNAKFAYRILKKYLRQPDVMVRIVKLISQFDFWNT